MRLWRKKGRGEPDRRGEPATYVEDIEIAWDLAHYQDNEQKAERILRDEKLWEISMIDVGSGGSYYTDNGPRWWQTEDAQGRIVNKCLVSLERDLQIFDNLRNRPDTITVVQLCELPVGHSGKHGDPGVIYKHPAREVEPVVVDVREQLRQAYEEVARLEKMVNS